MFILDRLGRISSKQSSQDWVYSFFFIHFHVAMKLDFVDSIDHQMEST